MAGRTSRSITVQWTSVRDADMYELQMREIVGQRIALPWTLVTSNIAGNQFTVGDLLPANNYQYRARAHTPKYGWSGYDGCAESAPLRTEDEEPGTLIGCLNRIKYGCDISRVRIK